MLLGDLQDAGGQRRREQRRLACGRRALDDQLDVLGEPHVEHLVRFVEHEDANAVEPQCLAADVIERAARRGDDDVRAAFESANLLLHGGAAVERDDADGGPVRVLVDRLADLHGQLARRDEDEPAGGRGGPPLGAHESRALFVNAGGPSRALGAVCGRRVRARVRLGQALDHRQGERRGLAGAGGGLGEQVAAAEHDGNRLALDRRRFFVAERRHGGEQRIGEPECLEASLR